MAESTAAAGSRPLRRSDTKIIGASREEIRLRGVCGCLNMENFITGYSANETLMRTRVREVIGDDQHERFLERLLSGFFAEDDARFLGEPGLNSVRIPVDHRFANCTVRETLLEQLKEG